MRPPRTPDQEAARLSEIRLLDIAALRPKIERLTRLARAAANAPFAYVTIVDANHVWQSAFEGQPESLLPREQSTSALISAAGQTIHIGDARAMAPDHPWVAGPPHIRFFCGAPIRTRGSLVVGAFCIADREARAVDDATTEMVEDVAALLGDEIDRMRAERGLAKAASEARAMRRMLKSFVRGAPVALAMTDRRLRFVEVSPRWRQDYGLQGRVLGRAVADLLPEAFAKWQAQWARALAGETISAERVLVPALDGQSRWMRVELGPWRNSTGEIGGVIAMTCDITEAIASLDRAERSEQRLRLAMGIADMMVYEADFRTRTVQVDGAADTFLKRPLTFDELTGDPWNTVAPEDRDNARALWDARLQDGGAFRTEYRMNRSDGQEVWAFSAAELVTSPAGKPERLVGVLKNVTIRRQAEAAVVAARDAAEASNRAKSEFLANMSHEIRTPLNGVMGVAAALARTTMTPRQSEMVGLIENSAAGLETILSDVLDFSRIESGHLEIHPESFDLQASLRAAVGLFEAGARAKGLELTLSVEPAAEGAFEGDPGRIRQIVSNLLSNAMKFTADGQVTVTARARGDGDHPLVEISIADTGIGFGEAVKARLFERFEQADGSITRRFGGSGLGLAISLSLANAMGGELQATSTPGQGSTFTFAIPLKRAAAPAHAPPPPAAHEPLARAARVLLAEDHPTNRRVVELILEAAGVDLTCVENGVLAVEAAAHARFDLILMDMQMPVMDGLTAIRAIRAAEREDHRPRTPIWGLSANALPEHVAASMAAGADGHLTKPISAQALFQVLVQACAGDDGEDEVLRA